jgi:cytochrome d ubiquinol oxidase subunit II
MTLGLMLAAVILFLPIVLMYTAWVFRVMKGQVTLAALHDHENH